MNSNFQITALNYDDYAYLFDLNDEELAESNAVRQIVSENPGFPCRVSLQDGRIGEEVILFTFDHMETNSPYQSRGPIYIRKNAIRAKLRINEVPLLLRHRILSLRAYDEKGMMIDARTIEGKIFSEIIQDIFTNIYVSYIHIHNAGPGCYNCRVDRAK